MSGNPVLRFTSLGIGLAVKTVTEPVITLPILLAVLYAPAQHVPQDVRQAVSSETVAKIVTALKVFVGLGIWKYLSNALSHLSLNNWTLKDNYEWTTKEIVVVTGGSSGIGAEIVDRLARKDIKVAIMDISPPIRSYPNVSFHKCDVTSSSEVFEAAEEIKRIHGGPATVLVNNAGIGHGRLILEHEETLLRKTFEINIISHFHTCKAFLPDMIATNHGHVIEIASMATYVSLSGMAAYCATKAGVLAFTESLGQELRHQYNAPKVRVSSVHPSWVSTPLIQGEAEKTLEKEGSPIMTVGYVGGMIADHILKGQSGQLVLPPHLMGTTTLRSWPTWLAEAARNSTRKTTGVSWSGSVIV